MHYTNYCARVKTTCEADSSLTFGCTIRQIRIPKTPMDLYSSEVTGIQSTLNVLNLTNGMDITHRLPL